MSTPPPPDPGFDLLASARAGDPNAYRTLFSLHATSIRAFARLRGAEDPDAVANTVMFDAFRGLSDFTGDLPAFKGWIFRIARNRLIDEHRMRQRRPEAWPTDSPPVVSAPSTTEDAVLADLAHSSLHPLLDQLTDEQREVLILRFVMDLSIEETAAALGVAQSAVKARQRRALAATRRLLDHTEAIPTRPYPDSTI